MQWEQRKHRLDKFINDDENVDRTTNPTSHKRTDNPNLGLDLIASLVNEEIPLHNDEEVQVPLWNEGHEPIAL
jgi:hypothetical protein